MNRECLTCARLGDCRITDAQKTLSHFVCEHYEEVPSQQIVKARCDVINQYGEGGLKAILSPSTEEDLPT